jgi:hypothetical protein
MSATLLLKEQKRAALGKVLFEAHPDYTMYADMSSLTKYSEVVAMVRPLASSLKNLFYRTLCHLCDATFHHRTHPSSLTRVYLTTVQMLYFYLFFSSVYKSELHFAGPAGVFVSNHAELDTLHDKFLNTAAAALARADHALLQHFVLEKSFIDNVLSKARDADAAVEALRIAAQEAIMSVTSTCQLSASVTHTVLQRMSDQRFFDDASFQAVISSLPGPVRGAIDVSTLHNMSADERISGYLSRFIKRVSTAFLGATACAKLGVKNVTSGAWLLTKIMDKNRALYYGCHSSVGALFILVFDVVNVVHICFRCC